MTNRSGSVTMWASIVAVAALVFAGGALLQDASAATPSIRLSPSRGAISTKVSVSASNFPANANVTLTWDGSRTGMPAARTNGSGAFQASFTVRGGVKAGTHSVRATSSRRHATATFTVTTSASPTPTPTASLPGGRWTPALNTSWQIQFTGTIDTSLNVTMYDLDGYDTSAANVAQLHAAGRKVVCYFSAGSWEDWRPDAAQFPASVKGDPLDGWPGENWLDIRRIDILGPIMEARLDMCKSKGFDAVDPDNVDAYTNDTGFPLIAADQLRYNRWLADAAHARGLSIGLKNDSDQAVALLDWFDFAIVEQCYAYNECDVWKTFVNAGKAVFIIEYSGSTSTFCPKANAANFNAIKKRLGLDAWRQTCR